MTPFDKNGMVETFKKLSAIALRMMKRLQVMTELADAELRRRADEAESRK